MPPAPGGPPGYFIPPAFVPPGFSWATPHRRRALVSGPQPISFALPPASWVDEMTLLDYAPTTLLGIPGLTLGTTSQTRVWAMTRVASHAGPVATTDVVRVVLLVRPAVGAGTFFRIRLSGDDYAPSTAESHRTFQVNFSSGSIHYIPSSLWADAPDIAAPAITDEGGGVFRLTFTFSLLVAQVAALHFGIAPGVDGTVWDAALVSATISGGGA